MMMIMLMKLYRRFVSLTLMHETKAAPEANAPLKATISFGRFHGPPALVIVAGLSLLSELTDDHGSLNCNLWRF
jgi:hypothetical protein